MCYMLAWIIINRVIVGIPYVFMLKSLRKQKYLLVKLHQLCSKLSQTQLFALNTKTFCTLPIGGI